MQCCGLLYVFVPWMCPDFTLANATVLKLCQVCLMQPLHFAYGTSLASFFFLLFLSPDYQ